MNEFTARLAEALAGLKSASRYRQLRDIAHLDRGMAEWNGRRMFNLSGNDYLGVAGDAALAEEFRAACAPAYGFSAASSRLLTGNHPAYAALEAQLEKRYRRSALVLNSGYHANTGILPALAGKGDLILADKLNHASLIDGLQLGTAEFRRYRHLDYQHLGNLLADAAGKYRQIFIVTESVFSMDGDTADLRRLAELKRQYRAVLMVDEAHSVGCFGPDGLGWAAEQGVMDEVDILMGTLGKAFGSAGAFVIADKVVRDYLINTMRPFIFTTALPPISVAWTAFVLERMPQFSDRRKKLAELGRKLRGIIAARNCPTGGSTQIVPLVVGDNDRAGALAEKMQSAGVLVFPIRPPTVPQGTARLRFSLSAALPESALERIDEVLK